MTLLPLLAPSGGEPGYLTLEEALEQRLVTITEVDQGGSVPALKLINRGSGEGPHHRGGGTGLGQAEPDRQLHFPHRRKVRADRPGEQCRAGSLGLSGTGVSLWPKNNARQSGEGPPLTND